jgi:hypothetical protein
MSKKFKQPKNKNKKKENQQKALGHHESST